MKVYLDNCVLIDVEIGRLSVSDFKRRPDTEYFFSAAHMDELLRALTKRPDVKDVRLGLIQELCGSNYISQDAPEYPMELEYRRPEDVFALCQQYRELKELIERYTISFNTNRDSILEELSLNKIEVSNISVNKIFDVLDAKMRETENGFGVDEFLTRSKAVTGSSKFSTLFNLLDSVCYWKDERNVNRFYDALHAYYAQYCDILVTDDRRMSIKAQAVYNYLGISTGVVSSCEYLKNIF